MANATCIERAHKGRKRTRRAARRPDRAQQRTRRGGRQHVKTGHVRARAPRDARARRRLGRSERLRAGGGGQGGGHRRRVAARRRRYPAAPAQDPRGGRARALPAADAAAPPPAAASPSTSSTDRWFDQRATVSVKVLSVGAPSDGAPSDGLGGDALAQLEDERALTRQLRARLTAEQDWRRQFLHQASAHPSWLAAAKAGADALDAAAAAADEPPRADAEPLPPPPLPPPLDAPLALEATPAVAHSHKLSPRVVGGELESIAFATPAAVVLTAPAAARCGCSAPSTPTTEPAYAQEKRPRTPLAPLTTGHAA